MGGHRLDSSHSILGQVACSCEHDYKASTSMQEVSQPTEELSASQEGLSSTELVSYLYFLLCKRSSVLKVISKIND
jgi:hypothetical protein